MKIEIEYLEKGKPVPVSINLRENEFFDLIQEGESYENDAIPKYNHAREYLEVSLSRLLWTKLNIEGTNEDRKIITHYYNNGESWMSYRIDIDGYEEMIHSTKLDEKTCHVVRLHKDCDGNWEVNYNGAIYDLSDGSQEEKRFDKI